MLFNLKIGMGVITALLIIGSHFIAYQSGYSQAKQQYTLEIMKQSAISAKQAHDASEKYQQDKLNFDKQVRQQNETIQKIINENSIYRNRCFDDDGLRELRAAIKNANSP